MPGSCGDPTAGATARFTAPEARNSAFAAPDGRHPRVSRIRQWGTAPRFLPLPFPDGRLPAACLLMRTWVCGRARLQGMLGTRAAFPWGTGGS